MSLDDILSQIPIDDIAEKFGVSKEEATTAVQQGGAVLLGGLAKNAETEEGSTAIQNALKKHEGAGAKARVDEIDAADGDKIVAHVLGDKKDEVAQKLGSAGGGGGIDFGKLLPMLAPIVMGILANKNKSDAGQSEGGIGGLIGGLLGGGNGGGGLDIGGLLGGVLGGGNSDASSGGGLDIGGLIGGLFGKK